MTGRDATTIQLTVRVVADADRWRETACSIAHRELTADEWATFVSETEPQVSACPAG